VLVSVVATGAKPLTRALFGLLLIFFNLMTKDACAIEEKRLILLVIFDFEVHIELDLFDIFLVLLHVLKNNQVFNTFVELFIFLNWNLTVAAEIELCELLHTCILGLVMTFIIDGERDFFTEFVSKPKDW
jgi:hypothetical protein